MTHAGMTTGDLTARNRLTELEYVLLDVYAHMTTGDLISALNTRDDLTELEYVLLDRLMRTEAALN